MHKTKRLRMGWVAVAVLLAAVWYCNAAQAQLTGTTSDVLSLPTLTIGGINSSFAVAVDQTNNSFQMTRTNFATALFATQNYVQTITAGNGISVNASTGAITISNMGVLSLTHAAVGGVQVSQTNGTITITNSGVRSLTIGGSGSGTITVSGTPTSATM